MTRADAAVASYGKAGRTWLRVMISRYCQLCYGIADDLLLEFDNFHALNSNAPKIFFTHDNYLRSYTGNLHSKQDFYQIPTLFLARRPQDVAVSQFFQWQHRMRPRKKVLNRYPADGADISIWEFMNHPQQGVANIVHYMNAWAKDAANIELFTLTRYEDLRAAPAQEMRKIIDFFGLELRSEWIDDCVEFASLEKLRAKEASNHFSSSGKRMQASDPNNPDSFKVRKAKVGGYKDYFTDEQIAELDNKVAAELNPWFGYESSLA